MVPLLHSVELGAPARYIGWDLVRGDENGSVKGSSLDESQPLKKGP